MIMGEKTYSETLEVDFKRQNTVFSGLITISVSILFIVIAGFLFKIELVSSIKIVAYVLTVWGIWGIAHGLFQIFKAMKHN